MRQSDSHFVHKIDYTRREKLVGIFILLASALLLFQLFVSTQVLDLFAATRSYTIELRNPIGVGADTKVKVSGLDVGWVESVDLTERNTFIISLAVFDKFHALIRQDSRASISKLAVVGDSVINISPGDIDLPVLPAGSTLLTEEGMTMDDILTRLQPVLEQTEAGVVRFSELLAALPTNALPDILQDLQASSENLKQLTTEVRQGNGIAGRLLAEDELSDSLTVTVQQAQLLASESVQLVRESRANMQAVPQLMSKLDALISALQTSADNLPALLEDTDQLVDDSNEMVESISNTWPLSNSAKASTDHEEPIDALPAN